MDQRKVLSKRMKPVCEGITACRSPAARRQFLKAITNAAQDYLDLSDPAKVAAEIRDLKRNLSKGSGSPLTLLDNLSNGALEMIEAYGEVPDFSALTDADEILDAKRDLLGILTSASKIIRQKSQNRSKTILIGQVSQGRVPHRREEYFVSRLATAYAAATGQPTSRSWSDEEQKDFEVVVELALEAVDAPINISGKKLIEIHIKNRNSPK